MRKLGAILCLGLIILLCSCGSEPGAASETYIVSGTVVEVSRRYYTTNIVVELNDGTKVPVWERYSGFSDYVEEGDYVQFKVQKVDSGYRIVGLSFEDEGWNEVLAWDKK